MTIARPKARIAALAVAALAVAIALGLWGSREYRERSLHGAVVPLVKATSAQLRDALGGETAAGASDADEAARRLEAQADEIDQRIAALQRLATAQDRSLVDAADLYLVTARELLRRMASSLRYRDALLASTRALRDLGASAGRRSGAWIGQTIAAKERAERDYSDYRRAIDAMVSLLESLAETRARLARQVDPAVLVEESLRAHAAERTRAAGKRAAAALDEARRLAGRP